MPDIGIIDTGADTAWPALATAVIQRRCLAGGDYTSRAHGTAVAEIAAAQGARLAVADVFGVDENNKLIASADAIAAAIDWLLSQRVTLMNISIEGPDNVVLAHVVRSAVAQGAMIVAAAGNGGPAASPVYPAAYPHVIAVTAVDDEDHVYPRANRGDYVAFAARGVRVPVSYGPKGPSAVSGTSFAAPAVAAELAARLADAERADPEAVLAGLQRDAVDLGAPGRDPIFGWGRITSRHRTSIASLQENRLPAIADGAGDNGR